MSGELTPWFPADVKPARVGNYQCREGSQDVWYWDGRVWRSPNFGWECTKQDRQWRGLASDPSKAVKP
jgi:hypothetical protein